MRSTNLTTIRYRTTLILCAFVFGCEKAPTWDELTGDSGTMTPSSTSDSPLPKYVPPPRNTPEVSPAASIVQVVLALEPHQLTDAHLIELTSAGDELINLTELDLERSRVTAAGLADIQNLKWLRVFNLSRMPVDAEILRKLESLAELEVLHLNHCPVDDAMLASIGNVTSLRELSLNQTQITDAGLRHLERLTNLETIDVSSCAIDGSGFKVFDELGDACRIKAICAHHTQFGREGARIVSGWPSLERLQLSQAGIDDRNIGNFQKCENLRELDVSFNQVTDNGVRRIDRLKHVHTLSLRGNRGVGNNSLAALKEWTELRTLEVDNTSCSPSGVRALKQSLPQASVSINGQSL